jgi:very-short-patch-repair endonuclease
MHDRKTATAKALRQRMTDTERCLWRHLRAHRFADGKFKRQQPSGPYIVDFVCFQARLVVEVDGGQHQRSAADRERDAWLQAQGFQVVRFWDNGVLTNLPAVLQKIADHLAPSPPPRPRAALHSRPAPAG